LLLGKKYFRINKLIIMKVKITFFFVLLVYLQTFYSSKSHAQVGLNWAVTDSANFSIDSAKFTAMAVSKSNGHIYVAFRDASVTNKLTVSRFNGTTWGVLGSAGLSSGAVQNCAVAVSGNIVYVAYADESSSKRLRVMRYNGTSWSNDGAFSIGEATNITISISATNAVYVSCVDAGVSSGRVMVYERNAGTGTWATITSGGLSVSGSTSVDSDIDFYGDLYVLYRDANSSNKATLKKYDVSAATWSTIGAEGFSNGGISSCAIKIDKIGNPVISYIDANLSNALKIFKRSGTSWLDITGTIGLSGNNAENKLYITNDNNVLVGFKAVNGAFAVYKHDAISNAWNNLGNPKGNTNTVSDIGIDIDINDKIFTCYTEPSQRFKANVRQLNCTAPPKPIITPSNTVICGGATASLQSSNTASNVASLWNKTFDNYEAHNNKLAELNDNDANNGAMSAATSPSGELWVVKVRKATNDIIVKKFTNNSWVQVGGALVSTDGETDGNATDIAFHPDGTCYVSFVGSNGFANFKKWNGTSWVQENFGWSTLSDTCKHTAISINAYGVVAFATSMKQASTGDYRPIVFTKLNGTWRQTSFFNFDAGSLDVTVDNDGNAFLILTDENDKSPVVSHTQKHGKVSIIKISKNNAAPAVMPGLGTDYGHYTQAETSSNNIVYFGYRKEKETINDSRTAKGYRILNGTTTLQEINSGLCEHAFTMGVSKAGKLYFIQADDYGTGSVLLTSINTGTGFAGIVSNYFQNNSISAGSTKYYGLQIVFDEHDAPIIVTSTALPNSSTYGDFRVYRVDRMGLGEANPYLTTKAGMYFTESNTGCGAVDTSSIINITKTAETNSWTGAANGNWNLTSNWGCLRLPNAEDVVSIPSGLSNYPTLTSSVPAANRIINALIMGSNTGVTVDGVNLVLRDSINVSSTANISTINNGYLEFAGSAQQNTNTLQRVNGSIRINNANNVVLDRNLLLTGGIDFVAGKLITNNFTLRAAHNLLSGADANSYIATSLENGTDATSGGLITAIPANSGTQFPVGTLASYNPVSISNTNGNVDSVTVLVDAQPIVTTNSNRHLNVTWNLTEKTAGSNTYTLAFFWNSANEGSLFSRSSCGIVRSNGSNSITYATGAAGATTVLPNFYSRTATGITSLSPWSVTSDATILPIELLSFTASQETNAVRINWALGADSNPKYFEVERSNNGIEFSTIEKVIASTALQYMVTDGTKKSDGIYYYRLKMVDKDGKITYSNTQKIYVGNNQFTIEDIYPQPIKGGDLKINLNATLNGELKFVISDVAGKSIFTTNINVKKGTNQLPLNVSSLKSGTYYLSIYHHQTKINTKPVIVY
jgi:hypothetical protein